MKERVTIIGAGLCGSLLALRLAQMGYEVDVYERRPDMRLELQDAGRSINLALSDRGLQALASAGIKEEVHELCIPMYGRRIHNMDGTNRLSNYSGRSHEYINSISRPGLNLLLLNKADEHEDVRLHFNHKCESVNVKSGKLEVKDLETGKYRSINASVIFGTDGAGSAVRQGMMRYTNALRFNFSQEFLTHGYKELSIHPGEGGVHQIDKNALHIWPKTSHMIIALPNLDGSFTVTMFHPYEGEVGFDELDTDDKIMEMFEKEYPSLLPYLPHLIEEYHENPTSNLATIRCNPWQAYGKAMLLGDAAHAIVPFYGQGMNASLEDVYLLCQMMDGFDGNWERLFKAYQDERIPSANAIADLALDNFYEMRDHVDDPVFIRKRVLEMALEKGEYEYDSKYSLVTFREDITYAEAMRRGRWQDQFLINYLRSHDEVTPAEAFEAIKKEGALV